MKKSGFTLLELVVVIALLAILAVTIIPRVKVQISKAKDAKAIAVLGSLRTLSEVYYSEENLRPFGEREPVKENDFSKVQAEDENGLDLLIPELNDQSIALFGDGTSWESGDSYTVPVGGGRENRDGELKYSREISYSFHAPKGTSADGIMIWFTEQTIDSDSLRFDTKGNKWIKY